MYSTNKDGSKMKIYEVGGCVRDRLLGKKPSDIDYVVIGASINEMITLGYKQVGKNFPVFIKNGCEYALARKEIKTGNKHSDFKFIFTPDITLQQDLERRDFTCNALAYDKENHQIIDYHNGIADINNKILRHVNSDHFPEDPLRVLRMCRFAAQLNFNIAPETINIATQMVNDGMIAHLSAERIWQEFSKALATPNFDKFITSMRNCGALKAIIPEAEQMFSTPENLKTHPEGNVGEHMLLAVKYVANCTPEVKFASFMHDIGKILTLKEQLPIHTGHEITGVDLINKICLRLKISNNFKNFAKDTCKHHGNFYHILKLPIETLYEMLSSLQKYNIDKLIDVFRSDYFGRAIQKPENEQYEKEEFLKKALKIFKNTKISEISDINKNIAGKDIKEQLKKLTIQKLQTLKNKKY